MLQRVQAVRFFCFGEVPTKEAKGVVREDLFAESSEFPAFFQWASSFVDRGLQVRLRVPLLEESPVAELAHVTARDDHASADVRDPVGPDLVVVKLLLVGALLPAPGCSRHRPSLDSPR